MAKNTFLTPAQLRQLLRYDPDTGKLYWRERTPDMFSTQKYNVDRMCRIWNKGRSGSEAFTANTRGYKQGRIFGRLYAAHRVIWTMINNKWPENQIDHINGVRGDNRIENLRSVSNSENMRNAKRPATNTSGVMGVCWDKSRNKWISQIMIDGKQKNLGRFAIMKDAIAARKEAELKYGFHPNHGRD